MSLVLAGFGLLLAGSAWAADSLKGQTVTLWAASVDPPKQLAQTKTGASGKAREPTYRPRLQAGPSRPGTDQFVHRDGGAQPLDRHGALAFRLHVAFDGPPAISGNHMVDRLHQLDIAGTQFDEYCFCFISRR
jgi:hypothetical protein